ncbi:MAG: phage tail tape measure protein [Microscillaceae bacterium]|nr:phage tail tape measure protein [Microscillaceae bacterium]
MIGINIIYNLKDQFSGGLNQIKNAFGGLDKTIGGLKLKNAQMFAEMRDQIPFLNQFTGFLKNPYGAAIAVVGGLIAAVLHLTDVSGMVVQNQQQIKAVFGATGQEVNILTAKSIALQKVFERDASEINLAANTLQKAFADTGLSAEDSLKLVQQSLQATAGLMDLDQLKEYPVLLKEVGLSADQAVALMSQQIKQGIYSDKGADTIKEAGLRLRELTPATRDAIAGIGLSATEIENSLKTGSKSIFDVIQEVSRAMGKLPPQSAKVGTAIADIFGGPGEDAGLAFITSLGNAELSMKNLIDLQDPFIKAQNQRLMLEEQIALKQQEFAPSFNQMKADFDVLILNARLLFYEVIAAGVQMFQNMGFTGGSVFALLNEGVNILRDAFISWLPYIEAGIHFLTNVFTVVFQLVDIFKPLLILLGALKIATLAYNAVLAINPFVAIAIAVIALIAALKTAYERSETFRAILAGMGAVVQNIIPVFKALAQTIVGIMTFNPAQIAAGVKNTIQSFRELNVTDAFKEGYKDSLKNSKIQRVKEARKEAEQEAKQPTASTALPGLGSVPGLGGGAVSPSISDKAASGVVAAGQQAARNITVNIEALHKGDNVIQTSQSISSIDLSTFQRLYEEMLLRTIRNVEATI